MHRPERAFVRKTVTISIPLLFLVSGGTAVVYTAGNAEAGGQVICAPCTACDPICSNNCPTSLTLTYSITVQANDTNSAISFSETDSFGTSFVNLTWGPGTSSDFTALTNYLGTSSPTAGSVFIDYLDPSSTYTYFLWGWSSCHDTNGWHDYHTSATYSASWTTSSDSATKIQGIVRDASDNLAPANQIVTLYEPLCSGSQTFDTFIGTGGTFAVTPGSCRSSPGFILNYTNREGYNCIIVQGSQVCNTAPWWAVNGVGHWNASVTLWAPGFYTLWAPLNYQTYVPASAEFVHTKYADISSYSSSIYSTTTSTVEVGGSGAQTSESSSYQWGTTSVPAGDNLTTNAEYWTTGTLSLNPVNNNRLATASTLNFFDQTGYSFNLNQWSDWQTSLPSSGECTKFNTASATFTLIFSGSFTVQSGYDVDLGFSLGVSSAGTGVDVGVDVSIPIQNTLAASSGYSTTVTFTFTNPYSVGTYAYFLVNTQGGSSSSSGSAMIAHAWHVGSC
jgi:hypothetical protein